MVILPYSLIHSTLHRTPISPESPQLPVYNCCISNLRNCTMSQIVEMGKVLSNDIPLDRCVWAPGGGITQIKLLNTIRVVLYHIMPAILLDVLLRATGQKPL